MFKRLFNKKKTVIKAKEYRTIVRWHHDEPWYVNLTAKDIVRFEKNPEVIRVDILG